MTQRDAVGGYHRAAYTDPNGFMPQTRMVAGNRAGLGEVSDGLLGQTLASQRAIHARGQSVCKIHPAASSAPGVVAKTTRSCGVSPSPPGVNCAQGPAARLAEREPR